MPVQYPQRDLTSQYISSSYQDVVQRYATGSVDYFLDGYGYVIISIPSASLGQQVLTVDQTASYAVTASFAMNGSGNSLTSSYALFSETSSIAYTSSLSLISLTSSISLVSLTSVSSSWTSQSLNSFTSSLSLISLTAISASWASRSFSSVSASYASFATLASVADVALLADTASVASAADVATSASWASQSLSSSFLPVGTYQITSSWAISSSYALFAQNSPATTLFTGSTYPITASWAVTSSFSITQSYITVTTFAVSSSFASQSLTSSLSTNVDISSSNSDFQYSIPFVVNSGSQPLIIDGLNNLTYDPATNTLIVPIITSSLYGTSSWANKSIISLTSSFASSSLSASYINIYPTNSNVNYYLPFVEAPGFQSVLIDTASIYYNPANNLLTVNFISASSVTASLFGTASWAYTSSISLTASFLDVGTYNVTSSWSNNSIYSLTSLSSSWASSSISSSYSLFAQNSPATTLFTGSTYPITASWAISASWAPNNGGSNLITGSTVPITASWAINTLTASSLLAGTYFITSSWSNISNFSLVSISASWSSASLSSSTTTISSSDSDSLYYITLVPSTGSQQLIIDDLNNLTYNPGKNTLVVPYITSSLYGTSSWAVNTVNGGSGTTLFTGSTYQITASWANNSIISLTAISASWASSSISASYAPENATFLFTGSTYPITASWAQTASWAINTINGGSGTTLVTGSTYQITSSWSINSQTASSLVGLTLDNTSSITAVTQSNVVVLQRFTGSYNAVFFDYLAMSASNSRAGILFGTWNNTSMSYTEYADVDIGDTSQVTMSMDLSQSYIQLLTNVNTSLNWTIRSMGRYL